MPKRQAEKTPPVPRSNPDGSGTELKLEDRVELMMRAIDSGILRRAERKPEPLPSSFRDLKTV